MEQWKIEEWFSEDADYFVFYDRLTSPLFSNLDEGWSSDSTFEEDFSLTTKAPYLELIFRLKMIIIIIRLQITREFIPFYPTRVTVTSTLYGELDVGDHSFSFLWIATPQPLPRGLHPYYYTCVARTEALRCALMVPH